MNQSNIIITILTYPGCMQSAVQGLKEMFIMANDIHNQSDSSKNKLHHFSVNLHSLEAIKKSDDSINQKHSKEVSHVIIIPPNLSGEYYLNPDAILIDWILKQHLHGSIICSVCVGAFILANTSLLNNREATTHWELAASFSELHPEVLLDINKILINDGDIITAGGVMSWVDLGLELVAQFSDAQVMRRLGKILVVDTATREQRYYQSFNPKLDHGDKEIITVQHYMQTHYKQAISVAGLSRMCCLSDRTFLRRFIKATHLKPRNYLQKIRIQKACELLETSVNTIESISLKVGYEDSSAFRKTFLKIMGLTPRDFKNRFSNL